MVNKGDESAHNVQAEIKDGKQRVVSSKKQKLRIDETFKVIFTINFFCLRTDCFF